MPACSMQEHERRAAAAAQHSNPSATQRQDALRVRHWSAPRHFEIGVHLPFSNFTNRSGKSTTLLWSKLILPTTPWKSLISFSPFSIPSFEYPPRLIASA